MVTQVMLSFESRIPAFLANPAIAQLHLQNPTSYIQSKLQEFARRIKALHCNSFYINVLFVLEALTSNPSKTFGNILEH